MFLLIPCATITDNVTLLPIGDVTKLAQDMDKARKELKNYSNTQFLIQKIQNGQIIMAKKVMFDNYLKAQVDLMKAYVNHKIPCPFSYKSNFTNQEIFTDGYTVKEQWALEIIMSRINLCAIYHAGAYSSLQKIFTNTVSSYNNGYKQIGQFSNNLQISFKYFNQGFEPLKRISSVFTSIQQLLTGQAKNNIQTQKQLFEIVRDIIQCNLVYLKLQKFRILSQIKICKDGAYAVKTKISDLKLRINKYKGKLQSQFFIYLDIAQIFYQVYSLYHLLLEHQNAKNQQDYGFVKKQFQKMIQQNWVVIYRLQKLDQQMKKFPNKQNYDNVMFAQNVINVIMQNVSRLKYKLSINIHQNKDQLPSINQVITKRIAIRNIWESLTQF